MIKKRHNTVIWKSAIADKEERLRSSSSWFPYPAFIAIGIATIIVGHIFFSLNPRLGNLSDVIYFDSDPLVEGGIWISVSLSKDEKDLLVTTASRKIIRIPVELTSFDPIENLSKYFIEQMEKTSINAGLAKKVNQVQSTVVISADQKLKYGHLKPIIQAIARSGISSYGFETKQQLSDL